MIPQLTNLDRPQYGGRFSTALVETKWTSGGWLERIGGVLVTGHFATSRDLYNRVRLLFSTVNSIVLLSRNREKKGRKREREGESGSRIPPRVFFFSFFLLLFLSFPLSVALQRFKIRPGSRRLGHVPSQGVHHNASSCTVPRFSACSVVPCIEMHT